jgi:endoglucanase
MASDLSRRRLLAAGAGCAGAAGWLRAGPAGAPPLAVPATVDTFRHGGLKGFVLGGVQREPALIGQMADAGANVARVFFPFRRCRDCTQFGRAAGDAQALQRLLDLAAAAGLHLVVVGSFDGIEQPAFWRDADLRASFVENWAWFAQRFGQHVALAGLDLMNEPNPPWPSGDVGEAQAAWHPLALQAMAAIRAEGVHRPIVFEPVAGGSTWGLRRMQPFADPQVVYSVHFYSPHDITHQGIGNWTRRIPYPAGAEWGLGRWDPAIGVTRWDLQRLELGLRDARIFQQQHGVPVYVGEFSCVRWAPQGGAFQWVRDSLELFTRYGWSWTYHEFRGWPGWDAEIDSADPAATARSPQAPVMRLLRSAMARLEAVADPSTRAPTR